MKIDVKRYKVMDALTKSAEKRIEKVNEQLQSLRSKASWILWILIGLIIGFIAR